PRSADGQCEVPECAETTNRTRRSFEADDDVSLEVQSQRIEVSELGAILDGDSEVMESVELTCQEKANHTSSQICLAFNPFIIFLAGMISMVMFAAFVAVIISLQRYRHYTMSQTNC
ncbi:unnamed protein product, partial [Nippostrongylus brasiliensis]|uniref:ZP domain-containing protein n=1 Tax=Nippostrongylus brasiliensis TaxID=27835 RepID=A0A0N4XJ09_NIPBR